MKWLRKPALIINEAVDNIIGIDETFRSQAPIQAMLSHPNLLPLVSESNPHLTDSLIGKVKLDSFPGFYGVNKAYNSEKYDDLFSVAQGILSQATTHRGNEILYDKSIAVPLADYQNWFSPLNGNIPGLNPQNFINQSRQESVSLITKLYNELKAKVEALKSKATATMKWALWELKKILEAATAGLTENANPKSIPAIIPITVGGVVEQIAAIASMILNDFLLKGLGIAGGLIEAFKWTVTSLVAKYLGGTMIAEACRYLAANVFRSLKSLLPSIFNPTGLFAGVWTVLQAYAPYIILAAIITILIIKRHQRILGEYLYVIGTLNGKVRVFGNIVANITTFEQMESRLNELVNEIKAKSSINYDGLWGFALKDNEKGAYAVDFLLNQKYDNSEEVETKIIPFHSLIHVDIDEPPWYLR